MPGQPCPLAYIRRRMSTTSLTRPAISSSKADSWAPGPLRPPPLAGALHVWQADLTALSADVGELLCADERARGERLPRAQGELWTRSRGVLRALLGRYSTDDPRSLRFGTGAYGKPALRGDRAQLRFNLSHSRHLALYAISGAGEVGVDVQVARPGGARRPIDEVALARRAFGDSEAERLKGLEQAARGREFLRLWTRHEAKLKCQGRGIGDMRGDAAGDDLWIAELDLGEGAAGAVAVAHAPFELSCWRWRL